MENPTLPRVYVLPRAESLLPAKGAVNTPQPFFPPFASAQILSLGSVATFLVLKKLSELEMCWQVEGLSATALKARALGQTCGEGVGGDGKFLLPSPLTAWL